MTVLAVALLVLAWVLVEFSGRGRMRAIREAHAQGISHGRDLARMEVQDRIDTLTASIPTDKDMTAIRLEAYREGVKHAQGGAAPPPVLNMRGTALPANADYAGEIDQACLSLVAATVRAGGVGVQYDLTNITLDNGQVLGDYEIRCVKLPN